MGYKAEVYEIKRRILMWLVLLFISTIVLCSVDFSLNTYFGFSLPVPSVDGQTLASKFFLSAKTDLLPPGVEIISTSPITVFLVQIKIAILGSFALLLPYLIFSLINYLSPALLPKEKRKLALLAFSSMLLFFSGMFFAYHLLVRSMFSVLLSFNLDFNVIPFLEVDEFMGWTIAALFMSGILFLLPIFMYMLSLSRIASSNFWKSKWREAFIVFLITASIITPDVSGVSVILLSLPMTLLYVIGILLSIINERKR